MKKNMQGHNHGGKGHVLWMLGIGGAVLVVQLGLGRSVAQSIPLAFAIACPLMMVGMMLMTGRRNSQHGSNTHDATPTRDRYDRSDKQGNEFQRRGRTRPTWLHPGPGHSPP